MSAPTSDTPLPVASDLTIPQMQGWSCAICRRHLLAGERLLGRVPDGFGFQIELWACDPPCQGAAT